MFGQHCQSAQTLSSILLHRTRMSPCSWDYPYCQLIWMTMKFSYSDSEDESDSKDEYDSDFYFSDIPDDHGYSDDAVFSNNDVVIAPTAPPFYPSTERVKSKRQSRLQRELESSLDGVKWSSSTALRECRGRGRAGFERSSNHLLMGQMVNCRSGGHRHCEHKFT